MKRYRITSILSVVLFLLLNSIVFAVNPDLILEPNSLVFSSNTFTEGKSIRIYATAISVGTTDLRGIMKFFDSKTQIQGDQPISVVAGKSDSVFVDWIPTKGSHEIKAVLVPIIPKVTNPVVKVLSKEIKVAPRVIKAPAPPKPTPKPATPVMTAGTSVVAGTSVMTGTSVSSGTFPGTSSPAASLSLIDTIYGINPQVLAFLLVACIFLILILALFLIFSYSRRRRRSKWEQVHDVLDIILRLLPKQKKK